MESSRSFGCDGRTNTQGQEVVGVISMRQKNSWIQYLRSQVEVDNKKWPHFFETIEPHLSKSGVRWFVHRQNGLNPVSSTTPRIYQLLSNVSCHVPSTYL